MDLTYRFDASKIYCIDVNLPDSRELCLQQLDYVLGKFYEELSKECFLDRFEGLSLILSCLAEDLSEYVESLGFKVEFSHIKCRLLSNLYQSREHSLLCP